MSRSSAGSARSSRWSTLAELLPPTEGIAISGLTFRRFDPAADYERLASLLGASSKGDAIDYLPTAASLRNDFEHMTGFDPGADLLLAEAGGELIGFGHPRRDVRDGVGVYWTSGTVLPAYRRRGLGRALVRWNEARGRAIARDFDDEGGRAFASWVDHKEGGARELLESEGYVAARWGASMLCQIPDALPAAPLPHGLEIRPVTEAHHRAVFDADEEAFRDHWGHREATEEDFIARFAEPELDTSLWRVAWDGDQIAGSVLAYIWKSENEALGMRRGWLDHISVRRGWRRRGLARALIVSALEGLRAAGMDQALLGVDTDNLTGAVRVYESLGFRIADRATQYRKSWPAAAE